MDNKPAVRMKIWWTVTPISIAAIIVNCWFFMTGTVLPLGWSVATIPFLALCYLVPLPDYMRQGRWGRAEVGLFFAQTLSSALFIILLYAEIYSVVGLDKGGHFKADGNGNIVSVSNGTKNPEDCLYFSLVTWTTLGYGDIQPTTRFCRFAAASEAFLQIIYLGFFVSVAAHIFQRVSPPSTPSNAAFN